MLVRAVFAAVLVAGALSGCGDDKAPAAAPAPSVSADPSTSGSAAPTVNPADKVRRNWVLVSLGKDKRTITLRWDAGTCRTTPDLSDGPSTAQVDLSETDEKVEILTSQYVEGGCQARPAAKWKTTSTVRLDHPLGIRHLVGCTPDPTIDCTKDWTKR